MAVFFTCSFPLGTEGAEFAAVIITFYLPEPTLDVMHLSMLCRRGGGRAWGGDLMVFVGPGEGHLTDLVLPGEGIFESFFARRGDI